MASLELRSARRDWKSISRLLALGIDGSPEGQCARHRQAANRNVPGNATRDSVGIGNSVCLHGEDRVEPNICRAWGACGCGTTGTSRVDDKLAMRNGAVPPTARL